MADRLFLSFWLRDFTADNMLACFEKVLGEFPFSRMAPRAVLRIYALQFSEPPLVESYFEEISEAGEVVAAAREFENPDCAYQLDCRWDIWRQEQGEWKLEPAAVSITCFAPLFESEFGEHLRVEVGSDSQFLPEPGMKGGLTPVRSNIRSLLRLAEDIEQAVTVDKRSLWSESGENLAERLQEALEPD